MATYSVELNETQVLALEYETERQAALPAVVPPGEAHPPPRTPTEVLQGMVTQHLDVLTMQVQCVVDPLMAMAREMGAAHRDAMLAALPRTSLAKYLRRHIDEEVHGWTARS